MPNLVEQIEQAGATGALERWKAVLLMEWLNTGHAEERTGPSAEDLARLLVDPVTLARLREAAEGPWEALAVQARSILAHANVGAALDAVEPE